ncbi:MAG: class I SAM-dependent methyltransferase [Chthonomonadales bacterium]
MDAPDALTHAPSTLEFWEERYRKDPNAYVFGRAPSPLAQITLRYWKDLCGDRAARILDLGCGEGRDAVFFAANGHQVTGVECAPSGVEKARRLAAEKGVSVAIHCTDLREFPLTPNYEVLFANNSLSALGPECLEYIARLQNATPSGGLNVLRVHRRECCPPEDRSRLYCFDSNELKFEYRHWRLLYYAEDTLWVSHSILADSEDGKYRSFAEIIAQKP